MTRIERLMAEVLLLQERRRTCEEIARALEVSRRTVIRDIQSLCEMGVPVVSRDGLGGGYSLVENYSIEPLDLSWQEALLLMMALDGLAKMSDSPFSAERSSLAAKLRPLIPDRHLKRLEGLRDNVVLAVPEKGPRAPMLDRLVEVVGSGTWLSLEYDGENGIVTRLLRPDKLYADRGLWYLEGSGGEQAKTLRVDRIREVQNVVAPVDIETPTPYGDPSHPLIVVRLTRKGARIVQRDRHLGEHVDSESHSQILEFRCPPSELDWFAKYFGGIGIDAFVLQPQELRERICTRANELLKAYIEDQVPSEPI